MRQLFLIGLLSILYITADSQSLSIFADSIRMRYKIPELAYAVVSSDSIYEIQALGFKRVNSNIKADILDKFRIGSNTKSITSYISAVLVKKGKINWDTKFFDLYPELKSTSNHAYVDLTLKDFLTFRANLIKWSYGNIKPTKKEIKGNDQQQRYAFMSWIIKQKPTTEKQEIYWSNPSYVAAGLMLEKATGKSYETLVKELGEELGINFGFGQPNLMDKNQPWGHDENLNPEKPTSNYKLNWLSSAGNINVSLPDYCKFIQLQLQGLAGKSIIFTAQEFDYFHFGLPEFSFGWFPFLDDRTNFKYSFHRGNPGTFLTKILICKDTDRAFLIFMNVQSEAAEEGSEILLEELKNAYGS